MKVRWMPVVAAALVRRPDLWLTAVRQLLVLAPNRWWARPPFVPVPDRAYLAFRMQTAYGDPDRAPEPDDLVTYLGWCKAWPLVTARPARAARSAGSAASAGSARKRRRAPDRSR